MSHTILQKIRNKMGESDIDSLIISHTPNIRYLTGFSGDFGYVIISQKQALFYTNSLYVEEARNVVDEVFEVIELQDDIYKSFSELDASALGKRIGFESDKTTFTSYTKLKNTLSEFELLPQNNIIEGFREIKSSHEIEYIKHAQAISEKVYTRVLSMVKDGVEECDLAIEIDYLFRRSGGERSAFNTIVASGPNTSKPHAVGGRRKISPGDLVLFDMGTVVNGYASDMTRTVVFGKASREQKKVYNAVLNAQLAAIEGIHSGVKCADVDNIARKSIISEGYGDKFVHSLGHGVGLEVHENPVLSKKSEGFLQNNVVVTVEPGIYISGWGGVRIEDMIVVKDNRCENLTNISKTLVEL
ncbi:MAG: aminopeptidase P family protein [Candidatus Latescibacteria bacterium]|nr:aminopeptidase P family protein [Candidatus Latescibacterota bacterium]